MSDPWAVQCIEGEGTKRPDGYRVAWVATGRNRGVLVRQTRMAFEQAWGLTLKPGQVVRHSCDNPGCVNPLHLQVGTQKDNSQDMVQRGRHGNQRRTHCKQGHALSEGNLAPWLLPVRSCLECLRRSNRESMRRKRARVLAN